MASFKHDSATVTIDREYFDTLLRRANLNGHDGLVDTAFPNAPYVPVPRDEYDDLVRFARQYTNLRRNLISGGVEEQTIALLSQEGVSAPQTDTQSTPVPPYQSGDNDDGGARLNSAFDSKSRPQSRPADHHNYGVDREYTGYHPRVGATRIDKSRDWSEADIADDFSPSYSADGPNHDQTPDRQFASFAQMENIQRPHYARMCRRTVALCGLPPGTTHWDVTSVVRGGLLLDIFLRSHDHMCLVSFLREEDAVRFYEFARRNDIYIRNKRVFIRWAERHFHLAGHVASKVGMGATRNIIIRRCDPTHTEESIRDDLDHIHNLIVIKLEFLGSSCYIKTNSVHNAMFARTCMMSRAKYKGSKIEWDKDECDQPVESLQKAAPPKPQPVPTVKKPAPKLQNRFATLRVDDDDDDSDDKFDTSSEMPSTVDVTA
ncbi:hypothetical protein F4778DRAFT_726235 [Xylariomycetidae sp. FL2044]|nr:hypothetical protein F4778DRAFT_726235 [Xylariomycetidae sp. FL2044]